MILLVGYQEGRLSPQVLQTIGIGLIKNPLVVSISTGLAWAAFEVPVPDLLNSFMTILGGHPHPAHCSLSAPRWLFAAKGQLATPVYLATNKLLIHPLAVGIAAVFVFGLDPFASAVMISCAAMPVAGNVYMIANHYEVPSERISIAILVSTTVSIVSISVIVGLVTGFHT